MQDLWRLPATELAGLIRSKQVSAKEAALAALARLDAVIAAGAEDRVTRDVEHVTGRPPRSFEQFAAAAFRPAG